jgi:chorismate mutase
MINKEEITEWRAEIDFIDAEIIALLERRFKVSDKIGKFKAEKGLPVEDGEREEGILNDRVEKSNLDENFTRKIFKEIIEESKRVQKEE